MTFQLGSISTGTLKTEDLLEAFLPYINPESDDAKEAQAVLERIANNDWPQGVEDWEQYQIEFDTADLVQSIIDQMECPPFVYFGAHPGDPADFGFWHAVEQLEEALRYRSVPVDDSEPCGESHENWIEEENVLVHVNDHGNITVYDMEHNELWSCV